MSRKIDVNTKRLIQENNEFRLADIKRASDKYPLNKTLLYEAIKDGVIHVRISMDILYVTNCLPGYSVDYSQILTKFCNTFEFTRAHGPHKNKPQTFESCRIDRRKDKRIAAQKTHAIKVKVKDGSGRVDIVKEFAESKLKHLILVFSGDDAKVTVPSTPEVPESWSPSDIMIPMPLPFQDDYDLDPIFEHVFDQAIKDRTNRLATYKYIHTSERPIELNKHTVIRPFENYEDYKDKESEMDDMRSCISAELPSREGSVFLCPSSDNQDIFECTYCEEKTETKNGNLYVYEAEIDRSVPNLKMHVTDADIWSEFAVEHHIAPGEREEETHREQMKAYWSTNRYPGENKICEIIVSPPEAVKLTALISSPDDLS